ncbi:MAG TPA: electron transport complex subunit RsxD [Gammaproteobacteria bacterium]|nr:electron transport complex subunit RsxD [Gammaproteobacteria bacterium]
MNEPFHHHSSPHLPVSVSVRGVMTTVMLAMIPGSAAMVYYFGYGVLVNMVLAVVTGLATEAMMLKWRARPLQPFISDGSIVLTALLLALAMPPLVPWWIPVLGTIFATILGKHLFGGLGYNPFNPAMLGYVMLLIAFPFEMTTWLSPTAGGGLYTLGESLSYSFIGVLPAATSIDAISQATILDTLRTGIMLKQSVGEIRAAHPDLYAGVSGLGWAWINGLFLLGGIWLMWRRTIAWQIPLAMLVALAAMALIFWLFDAQHYSPPLFHLFSGAAMLGAFFIATDPVTASTTPRGRLIYGAGIGVLVYVIRSWGGYPDGVAFAVLLMNMTAPTIDYFTQPRVFGEESR